VEVITTSGLPRGTENARPENAGRSKLQDWKMREKACMDSQTPYFICSI